MADNNASMMHNSKRTKSTLQACKVSKSSFQVSLKSLRLAASFNYIYTFRLGREGGRWSHSTIHQTGTRIRAESIISHPLNSPRIIRTHRWNGIKCPGRIVPKICYRSVTRWQWISEIVENSRWATKKRSFQDFDCRSFEKYRIDRGDWKGKMLVRNTWT